MDSRWGQQLSCVAGSRKARRPNFEWLSIWLSPFQSNASAVCLCFCHAWPLPSPLSLHSCRLRLIVVSYRCSLLYRSASVCSQHGVTSLLSSQLPQSRSPPLPARRSMPRVFASAVSGAGNASGAIIKDSSIPDEELVVHYTQPKDTPVKVRQPQLHSTSSPLCTCPAVFRLRRFPDCSSLPCCSLCVALAIAGSVAARSACSEATSLRSTSE